MWKSDGENMGQKYNIFSHKILSLLKHFRTHSRLKNIFLAAIDKISL